MQLNNSNDYISQLIPLVTLEYVFIESGIQKPIVFEINCIKNTEKVIIFKDCSYNVNVF